MFNNAASVDSTDKVIPMHEKVLHFSIKMILCVILCAKCLVVIELLFAKILVETVKIILLSEDGIELFGYVVVLVTDSLGAQLEHNVRVCLAVQVHGVQVVSLDHVHSHEHMDGVVVGQPLEEAVLRVQTHDRVVFYVLR